MRLGKLNILETNEYETVNISRRQKRLQVQEEAFLIAILK